MRRIFKMFLLCIAALSLFTSCNSDKKEAITPDYESEEVLEAALNDNVDVSGKCVLINVDDIDPNSFFGFNIMTGEHLNFISNQRVDVKKGDKILVKVVSVRSFSFSYLIEYELID